MKKKRKKTFFEELKEALLILVKPYNDWRH